MSNVYDAISHLLLVIAWFGTSRFTWLQLLDCRHDVSRKGVRQLCKCLPSRCNKHVCGESKIHAGR